MPEQPCLSGDTLRAFLSGELGEREQGVVVAHLEACPSCELAARQLDGLTDPLLRRLRGGLRQRPAAPGRGDTGPDLAAAGVAAAPAVPGYEVLGELGRGGMGVVYQARQVKAGRLVALKVMRAAHPGAAERARFRGGGDGAAAPQRRARLRGRRGRRRALLLHGVLPRRQPGPEAGRPAPAPGRGGRPRRGAGPGGAGRPRAARPAPRPQAEQRAAGGRRHPKVTDFGLAKQPGHDLTATGALLGTPSYMAPEQAAGKTREVGPAADVYALGAILYEMLTGRPPFRGATPLDTLEQVRNAEPVPPSRLNPKCPRDLETVCLKCLHKEPSPPLHGGEGAGATDPPPVGLYLSSMSF